MIVVCAALGRQGEYDSWQMCCDLGAETTDNKTVPLINSWGANLTALVSQAMPPPHCMYPRVHARTSRRTLTGTAAAPCTSPHPRLNCSGASPLQGPLEPPRPEQGPRHLPRFVPPPLRRMGRLHH